MSEAAKPEPHPFERLKDAMRKILTVSKPEILRCEAEERKAMEKRKARRADGKAH